jgi:hypothetical protein
MQALISVLPLLRRRFYSPQLAAGFAGKFGKQVGYAVVAAAGR